MKKGNDTPDISLGGNARKGSTRKVVLAAVCVAIAVAAAVGAYLVVKDYYAPHTYYYADYVECNNIPVGINRLTEEQIATRHSHYRFEENERKVIRVSHCNSAGTPIPHEHEWDKDRPAIMVMEYNAQGKASKCTYEDVYGVPKMVWKLDNESDYVECLWQNKNLRDPLFTDDYCIFESNFPHILERIHNAHPARLYVERDAKGRIIRELFKKVQTAPVQNEEGAWGRAYDRNEKGQVVRVRYLNKAGKPLRIQCGQRAWGTGYSLERNAAGDVVKMLVTDADGNALVPIQLSDRSRPWEPWNRTLGKPWITVVLTRDAATANITEKAYLDVAGNLCMCEYQYAKATMQYDKHGNVVVQCNFQQDGKPCAGKGEFAKKTMKYDTAGRLTEESYDDANGKPWLFANYHKKTVRSDEAGRPVEEAFFDKNGEPCLCLDKNTQKTVYAKKTLQYSADGRQEERSFFNEKGDPVMYATGYAKMSRQFDACGRLVQEAYFGITSATRVTISYDAWGRETELACFYTRESSNSKTTVQYDEYGNITEIAYFGPDGEPCCSDHVAKETRKYDAYGNMTEKAYFGTDGKPCMHSYKHVAKETWQYDASGNMTASASFDAKGKHKRHKYDACGRDVEEAYFDEEGKPCTHSNPIRSYIKRITEYNDEEKTIKETYYDAQGKVQSLSRPMR